MPHKKSASSKKHHRELRTWRKWQGILFEAIPKLFARLDGLFDTFQIDVISLWNDTSQWISKGNGRYHLNNQIKDYNNSWFPYLNGLVKFKNNKNVYFQFQTNKQPYEFTEDCVFLLPLGSNFFEGSKNQCKQINHIIVEWYRDALNMYKMKKRMNLLKRDIVAAAWHPRRVSAWLESGATLENM